MLLLLNEVAPHTPTPKQPTKVTILLVISLIYFFFHFEVVNGKI
jgi:hypothetical protein